MTAWIAHWSRPDAQALFDAAYVFALLWTYVAAWTAAALRAGNQRHVWFRATAVTGALAIAVGALEGTAAAGAIDWHRVREAFFGSEGMGVGFIGDRDLSYRRQPRARWAGRPLTDMANYFNRPFRVERPIVFSTDSQGFRNPTELTRADIALIGDSYVEGWLVSDEETMAARIHQEMGLTVANFGVAGYGTLQERRVLERYALPLEPRLVAWFFFEGNDLDDDQNFENAMLAYEPTDSTPDPAPAPPVPHRWRDFAARSFTRNAFLALRQVTGPLIPNRLPTFGWFRDRLGVTQQVYFYDFYATRPLGEYERQRLLVTRETLRQVAALCRSRNIDLVVFYVPIKFRVYRDFCTFPAGSPCPGWHPWNLEAEFARLCVEEGIHLVSLTDAMRREAVAGRMLYRPDDSHWNAAGQAFVAEQVGYAWRAMVHSAN
jgi:hypothetical protein